jgi:quercetin dioxygenase-like cupin family protein
MKSLVTRAVADKRNKNMRRILIGLALLGLARSGFGQEMKMVQVEDLVWKEHPVFKGAQTVILVGDPMKAETIVQRTKFPPNYRVPPHTHPYAEVVTVLSGNYWNSFGQSFDKSKGVELHPGSVFVLPAGHAHYTWTEDTEVIVQVNFTGPGGVTFINPADDPRKKGGAQTRQSPDAFGSKRLPAALFVQPNQSLQPIAGRPDNLLFAMQYLSILINLAAASDG